MSSTNLSIQEHVLDRKLTVWIGIFAASVLLLFNGGAIGWSDGTSMYEVARSIVEDGDVTIQHGVVWRGKDGHYYSPFGLGLSLVAILPYVAITPVANLTPAPEVVRQAGLAAIIPVIVALLTVALYRLSRRIGATSRTSLAVALGAVAGTFIMVYSKDFCSEPLATLFIVLSIERAIARCPGAAGAAAAAAALTRPQYFAFAPLLLWRIRSDVGWSALFRSGVPLVIALLISVGYNFVRFEDPLNFGYSNAEIHQGFTTPFLVGATDLLFHPEKSILLFAPIIVLVPFGLWRLWSKQRTAFWLLAGNLALTFAMSATWWDWGGGWVWGPRLLIPGVIPSLAAIGVWIGRGDRGRCNLVSTLFVLGSLINTPAMLIGVGAQLADQPHPRFGPNVLRQFSLIPTAFSYTQQHLYERNARRYFSVWQVKVTQLLGKPGLLLSACMSLILVVTAALALYQLRKAFQKYDVSPRSDCEMAPTVDGAAAQLLVADRSER